MSRAVPPERLVDPVVVLERVRPDHLAPLQAALEASHPELHDWMDWAGGDEPQPIQTTAAFLRQQDEGWQDGVGFSFVMGAPGDDGVAGCCSLMRRVGEGGLEIGYWVRTDLTGRGIATAAAGLLTEAAFTLADIERVEIHHDEANVASGRVAEKLGYTLTERLEVEKVAAAHTGVNLIWTLSRPAAS